MLSSVVLDPSAKPCLRQKKMVAPSTASPTSKASNVALKPSSKPYHKQSNQQNQVHKQVQNQNRVPLTLKPTSKRWKKRDFESLKTRGKCIRRGGFFLVYKRNQLSFSRYAFVFPKYTGNAVHRNRFKRWGRHFLKDSQWPFFMDLLIGFDKRKKTFYQGMTYEKFCNGFQKLYVRIQ